MDLVVVGAGMAGMVAALTAAEAGLSVTVIEKDRHIGGNAAWATGFDLEGASLDQLRREHPEGRPHLQAVLVERFASDLSYLTTHGFALQETRPGRFEYVDGAVRGSGARTGFRTMREAFVATGGRVFLSTSLSGLLLSRDGAVDGVVAERRRVPLQLQASAVLLATGGYAASDDLKRRLMGQNGALALNLGTAHHGAEGITAALEAGASLADGIEMGRGGIVFAPPFDPPDGLREFLPNPESVRSAEPRPTRSARPVPVGVQRWVMRAPGWGNDEAVLVNLAGERYVDEGSRQQVIGMHTNRQECGVGFALFDARLYSRYRTILQAAQNCRAVVYRADSLQDLTRQLASWTDHRTTHGGVNDERMLESLNAYNAYAAGRVRHIWPPRTGSIVRLDTPPYFATPVTAGVIDAVGGLEIDAAARVLGHGGSPVANLYAAGADAGRYYAAEHGGLAAAMVFGRVAAESVAATLR